MGGVKTKNRNIVGDVCLRKTLDDSHSNYDDDDDNNKPSHRNTYITTSMEFVIRSYIALALGKVSLNETGSQLCDACRFISQYVQTSTLRD
jgi:hypothetical protein